MDFKWKEQIEPVSYSDDDFYAICNGYLRPEDLLADQEQVDALYKARDLLESFFSEARGKEYIEEM